MEREKRAQLLTSRINSLEKKIAMNMKREIPTKRIKLLENQKKRLEKDLIHLE